MGCFANKRLIPAKVTAGLSFAADIATAAYPAPEWSLTLYLRGPKSIDLVADATGQVTADAAATLLWTPGPYRYQVRAEKDGDVFEVDASTVEVEPDFTQLPDGTDVRSQNEIALEAIKAVLAKRATQDQQRYTIKDRELWRTPIADLLKLQAFYVNAVSRERARANGSATFGRPVLVRFHS